MTKHKHAELIKAWAEGAEIETFSKRHQRWVYTASPAWNTDSEYRLRPSAIIWEARMEYRKDVVHAFIYDVPNLRLSFDRDTKKLIKAEVLA